MNDPRGGEAVYHFLLRLFPRPFQQEFAAEMQAAFHDLIREARSRGRGSLAQVYFFELVDLPFCLLTEHLAHVRKEWSMNRIPHGSRSLRSAEMGALGLLLGLLLYFLALHYLILPDWWYNVRLGQVLLDLRDTLTWAIANAFLGVFLALSIGGSRKAVVRAALIMGGLTLLGELLWNAFFLFGPGYAVTKAFWSHQRVSDQVYYTSQVSYFWSWGCFPAWGWD